MKEYIEVNSLWKCETCFHHQNGKCSSNIWCDNGESYRPAYNKLPIIKCDAIIDEKILVERLKSIKDGFAEKMNDRNCLNKTHIIYLFDKIIKEINNMSIK